MVALHTSTATLAYLSLFVRVGAEVPKRHKKALSEESRRTRGESSQARA